MGARLVINDDFINNQELEVGDILWYVNDDIDSNDPHPHVVVAKDGNCLYTVCGTSKQKTIERKAKNLKHPDYSFFPAIGPSDNNTLGKLTFFDCCSNFDIHITRLQDKYQEGEIVTNGGAVTYAEYCQIRHALRNNPTIDICDLLIHLEDD